MQSICISKVMRRTSKFICQFNIEILVSEQKTTELIEQVEEHKNANVLESRKFVKSPWSGAGFVAWMT